VDHSLLSRYVLKPYWWSQVINIFPMSMAPNAVSTVVSFLRTYRELTMGLDHSVRFCLCNSEHYDYALLLSEHGPGLPCLGILVLGYWAFLVSDF
jgi:hypothetical protein